MSEKKPPHEKVHNALSLDGRPESIKQYYANWAETYDQDVDSKYSGPDFIAEILANYIESNHNQLDPDRSKILVADIGCGSGLVGVGLSSRGFVTLDGMDISSEMVELAAQRSIYRDLYFGDDINKPLRPEWRNAYDVSISCGVFTLGHVDPEALYPLIDITRQGGLLITSTRTAYYDATDYQKVSDKIEEEGLVQLKQCLKDAPYTEDGDAHYWVYEIC
ncbi:MAG: putative TPR repeat methyltransferase [Gammaproteobacteria bacterium]|jgi:predicted TPR repeat methyltransferase